MGGLRLFFTKRITPKIFPGGGWQWGGGTLRYPWYIMYIMYIYRDYYHKPFETVSLLSNHIFPLRFSKEKDLSIDLNKKEISPMQVFPSLPFSTGAFRLRAPGPLMVTAQMDERKVMVPRFPVALAKNTLED